MSGTRHRPVGLILASVVLGLFALSGLFSGVVFAITAFYIRVPQAPASAPPVTPLVTAFQLILAFITLAISTFTAFTVFGLFRLKRWARYSIIVFGGLIAAFSAFAAVLFLVLAFQYPAFAQMAQTPGPLPSSLRTVFLVMFGVACVGVLIGGWWLVYFNLRSTSALFANSVVTEPFRPQVLSSTAIITPRRSVLEVLVICLAALYLLSAVCGLVTVFTRMPLYLLGMIVRGTPAVLTSVALVLLTTAIGIGLLRRFRAAWVAALTFDLFRFLSSLVFLLPGNRASFASYQQELMQRLTFVPGTPSPEVIFGSSFYIVSFALGVAVAAAIAWLLIRARPLFEHPEQAG